MKTVYPITLTKIDNGYVVYVPDLQINTEGSDLADAISMARDAIGLWGICQEDTGNKIPIAKTLNPKHTKNEILSLVDIDFTVYRRANELRTVRKNVTLPSWLNDAAEKEHINFSKTLQDALMEQLNR